MNGKQRVIALALVALMGMIYGGVLRAQYYYSPEFSIGGHAGMTMSSMAFAPKVKQSMISGAMFGVTARYTEERFFGLIAELNLEQRGWKEKFDDGTSFEYSRSLTYIQIPFMTHFYFGSKKFKGFVNLGPSVSFLIGNKVSSNFNYANPAAVEGFDIDNRHTSQMSMEIKNKFDYGVVGGAGMELIIKRKHSIMLEARYYFGLGNIFPSAKKDEFSASRSTSIEVCLGYMFHLK